ncbi:MAG TPA: APC family permease [Allosphingosinicella sp.]|nr:APC family permease [Allosphingosinicella sp.]
MSLADLLIYGLVFIGPTAPMPVFGIVFNRSHGMVPLVYLVGLAAMIFTARSYMKMARLYPVAGSAYAYASRTLGSVVGFLTGWAMLLDYLLIPALANVVCVIAIQAMLPGLPWSLLILGLLAFTTIVNLLGIETTARASIGLLILQALVLAAFTGAAMLALARGDIHLSLAPFFNPATFSASAILGAASLGVLSFLGFDAISTLSEEAKDGAASIARATMLTLVVAAGLFMLQTWLASLFVPDRTAFPADAADGAFYAIAGRTGGPWLKFLVAFPGVLLGAMAGSLTGQTATARLIFGMARDGRLPRGLAHLNAKRRVPDRAILLVAAITLAIGLFVQDLELLTSIVCFGALVGFAMVNVSMIVHVWRARGASGWSGFLSPALGLAVTFGVLLNTSNDAKLAGLGWLAIGALLYALRRPAPLSADLMTDAEPIGSMIPD